MVTQITLLGFLWWMGLCLMIFKVTGYTGFFFGPGYKGIYSYFSLTRIQSKVLYPPISPTQRWVSAPHIPRAFHPLLRNFPPPSSAPLSTRCPHWSLTHRWAGGIRPPPRHRMLWVASQQMENTSQEWQPAVWTRCLSTLFLVRKSLEQSLHACQLKFSHLLENRNGDALMGN